MKRASDKPMTKGEREDLLRLVRSREKVLKSAATQRAAQMLADFEEKCAKIYSFDDDVIWKQALENAQAACRNAQKVIADRCEELGIPKEFQPTITNAWFIERGQNAVRSRRDELRRVAKAQIAEAEASARVEIERLSVQAQTEIIASGLESEGARAFFDRMPTVEALMPALDPKAIETRVTQTRRLN